jgi:hypothetical protein
MRFLRRAWWAGIATSTLLSLGGGYVVYVMIEPVFRDLREQHVLTKTDLEGLNSTMSADIRQLSGRLTRLEEGRTATLDDLQNLKTTLEKEIQAIRSGTK